MIMIMKHLRTESRGTIRHIFTLFIAVLLGSICCHAISTAGTCSHVFTDWVIRGDALYRECTLCEISETKDISDHDCIGGAWVTTDEEHQKFCTICQKELVQQKHCFSDWTTIKQPTDDACGEKERTCTICGFREIGTIPPLEKTETTESLSKDTDAPKIDSSDTNDIQNSSNLDTSNFDMLYIDTWKNPYIDISEKHPYYNAVRFVTIQALFQGIETKEGLTFAPSQTMTRAMFVTVLGRMAKINVNQYKSKKHASFSDVAPNAWYAPYAAWAHENNIIRGYPIHSDKNSTSTPDAACRFAADDTITIEQAAVILARYASFCGISLYDASALTMGYPDSELISDWAAADVGWCIDLGIYVPKTTLSAKEPATRALIADMLYRYAVNVTE